MSQPAAPAATIVTALFLNHLGRVDNVRSGWPVPSHPLGDLKDKPAKGSEADAPEKNDRDHCLPLSYFYITHTTLIAVAASNKLLRSNRRSKGDPASRPQFYGFVRRSAVMSITVRERKGGRESHPGRRARVGSAVGRK
jgi:hypothetical protein